MYCKSMLKKDYYGLYFNENYNKDGFFKFYKFLDPNLMDDGFEYKLGVNVDMNNDYPSKNVKNTFFKHTDCHLFLRKINKKYYTHLAHIKILDDAKIYRYKKNMLKADKIMITKIISFDEIEDSFWIDLLKYDGNLLKFIKEQTYDICTLAVKQNGLSLLYVKNDYGLIDEKLCKAAVQQNGSALQCVKNQTLDICKIAVQQHCNALYFVKNQTDELCKLAVINNAWALRYVKEQSEEICKLAVQNNGDTLRFVKNQTEEICRLAVRNNKFAIIFVNDEYKDLFWCGSYECECILF